MLIEKTVEKVDRKPLLYRKTQKKRKPKPFDFGYWQGREDSNPRPTVLETGTLPTELYPCIYLFVWEQVARHAGFEPATYRFVAGHSIH